MIFLYKLLPIFIVTATRAQTTDENLLAYQDFDLKCAISKVANVRAITKEIIPGLIFQIGTECNRASLKSRTRMDIEISTGIEQTPNTALEMWNKTLTDWPDIYTDLTGKN